MNILAVSQYYWPEPFNVSDICEELVQRGHSVTVLTGLPNYPEGEIYYGYEKGQRREEIRNGVQIVRSWLWPRKTGPINRFLNYESFSRVASRIATRLNDDFDVVISFEISPVMSACPAIAYSSRFNKPLLLYVIDIWPECLVAGGIKKDSLIYNHYKRVAAKIYSSADVLVVTSPSFRDYLADLIGSSVKSIYLPQYAEDIFSNENNELPDGYEANHINLTFAGNVGAAQSVKTIVQAASLLQAKSNIIFHVIGSGSELEHCKELAEGLNLSNIIFHGRKPLGQMPAYYQASDAMLATFSSTPILAYTLPRKIQSYMAAGRPVIGAVTGEAKKVIEEAKCGFCCETEDYKGLAEACDAFGKLSAQKRSQLGESAKAYYEKHFSRQVFFGVLENALEQLKGTVHHD